MVRYYVFDGNELKDNLPINKNKTNDINKIESNVYWVTPTEYREKNFLLENIKAFFTGKK